MIYEGVALFTLVVGAQVFLSHKVADALTAFAVRSSDETSSRSDGRASS